MTTVTGVVTDIKSRNINTKRGMSAVYDLFVDGVKYGAGFTSPKCSVGDTVEFFAGDRNGYPNVDGPVRLVTTGGGAATPTAGVPKNTAAFPVSTDSREYSIIRQSSLKSAVDTVNGYHGGDASMSLIEYVNAILETAYTFTDFSSGQREVKAVTNEE